MIDHDVQMKLLEIGVAAFSAIGGSFGVLKVKSVLRHREAILLAQIEYKKATQRADLRAKVKLAKQSQLAEMAKTFNQNVQHLHILVTSLQTKLIDTAEKAASTQGKLELVIPLLTHIRDLLPRFAGTVEDLNKKVDEAQSRALSQRPIPGSGGKVIIEHPPQTHKEKKS